MMNKLLTAVGLVLWPSMAAAQPAPPLMTLEDALRRAKESNLSVRRATEEVAAADAQRRAARSLIFPKIGITGSLVRNTDEVTFGSESDARTILPQNDWNFRLVVNQPLFAGLREKRAYDQARLEVENARIGVVGAQDAALLQVAGDYLSAVQGELLLEIEERNRELAALRRVQASDLYEAGETTRVDVLRAETAVKAAERRIVGARQLRDASLGRLRVALALDGALTVAEPTTAVVPQPSETDLLARAEELRADVRTARNAVRIAELEVSKQKGAYFPVLTADAGYVRQKTTFPKDEYGFAALRFTVPLFAGGETGARVAAARARQRQAELILEEARRTAREDVHTAVLGIDAARTSLALAQEQLAASEVEYQHAFERYRAQETTSLDLEASETSLADARRAVATARLELRLAELRAWAAAGALNEAVNKEGL